MRILAMSAVAAVLAMALFVLPGGSATTTYAVPDACGNDVIDVPDFQEGVFDFTEACFAHDDCYAAGGTERDRSRCDANFLKDMRDSCRNDFPGQWLKIGTCNSYAFTYYLGVRIGGWAFFPYGNQNPT